MYRFYAYHNFNRTNDEEKRPSPCDLRDSREIEQNCSKLILMWCVEKNFNELGQVESKTIGVDVALIKIHPHSGWYFLFGHSPNTTGKPQVASLLA